MKSLKGSCSDEEFFKEKSVKIPKTDTAMNNIVITINNILASH